MHIRIFGLVTILLVLLTIKPSAQNSCPDPDDFTTSCMNGTGTCDGMVAGNCEFTSVFSTDFSGNNKYVNIQIFADGNNIYSECLGPLPSSTTSYQVTYIADCNAVISGIYEAYTNSSQQNPCGGNVCEVGFCAGDTCQEGILPVELVSFDAEINDGQVKLRWITSQEVNNEYFRIDRSSNDLIWHELAKVNGSYYSNTEKSYFLIDKAPLPQTNYYRLAQIDLDGTTYYSPVVTVNNNQNDRQLYYSISDHSLVLSGQPSDRGRLLIMNSQGQTVAMADVSHQSKFELTRLIPGIYFANIQTGGNIYRRSFIVP